MRRKEPRPGRYGWCWHCKTNVESVIVDQGFGYDYGSISEYHAVEDHVCPKCSERVNEPKDEEVES